MEDESFVKLLGCMDHVPRLDANTLGIRKLVVRFFAQNYRDLSGPSEKHHDEALDWFHGEDADPENPTPFSLLWCCCALWPDQDEHAMRKQIRSTMGFGVKINLRTENKCG